MYQNGEKKKKKTKKNKLRLQHQLKITNCI